MNISKTAPVILFLICLLAYANSFTVPWHYDDLQLFNGSRPTASVGDALAGLPSSRRGVVDISFALNRAVAGQNPALYHAGNLAIHAFNALLLFAVIRRLFGAPRGRDDAAFPLADKTALLGAAVFAAHPLAVQAVTYVIQRYASLAVFFYLLAVYGYLRLREQGGGRFAALALVAALAAFHSKENMVTLPLTLAALEFTLFAGPHTVTRWRWVGVVGLLSLIVPLKIFMPSLFGGGPEEGWTVEELAPTADISAGGGLGGMLERYGVFIYYLRFLLFPVGLSIHHPLSVAMDGWWLMLAGSFAIAGGMVALAWRLKERRPVVSFLLLFLLIAPAVEILWPDWLLFYEHWAYLALAPFCALAAYGFWRLPLRGRLSTGLAVALVAVLMAATFTRNRAWATPETLWLNAWQQYPESSVIQMSLGELYIKEQDFKTGCPLVLRAYDGKQPRPWPDFLAGTCYMKSGRLEKAEALFSRIAGEIRDPQVLRPTLMNLSEIYRITDRPEKAQEVVKRLRVMDGQ